ncbi:ATP-binding protein (plasmid) [Undibacterium sp. YM2]|uniref:DEAD/DEAH box helicase n=1 Tax=Undibacterium sp. YM2 TaxID=2058625 RepID=UPI001331EDDB|nr:ATP-binding protein [Undibacterium sp. YM2]BBB70192.1 ATP-binding protein [Undibacterium sp. YM2]
MKKNILEFWRIMELANLPDAPNGKIEEQLPWKKETTGKAETNFLYVVYIGISSKRNIVEWWQNAVLEPSTLDEDTYERVGPGDSWLAAFAVDSTGKIMPDTYIQAGYSATPSLMKLGQLDRISGLLSDATQDFKDRHTNSPLVDAVDETDICNEFKFLKDRTDVAELKIKYDYQIKKIYIKSSVDASTQIIQFLNSFFLDDLQIAIKEVDTELSAPLSRYLNSEKPPERVTDLLENTHSLVAHVNPTQFGIGRWPASAKYHLAVAQQAAVSEILKLSDTSGLVAVNGPPGTGKTTLLCDVIADIIVQRGLRLAALSNPDGLFLAGIKISDSSFYPIAPEIMDGSEIVVASSNNSAVENISLDLPNIKKIDGIEHPSATYFVRNVGALLKRQSINNPSVDDNEYIESTDRPEIEGWGIIAAAAGKSSNRKKIANVVSDIKNELFYSTQQIQSEQVADWLKAKWQEEKDHLLRSVLAFKEEQVKLNELFEAVILLNYVKHKEKVEHAITSAQVLRNKLRSDPRNSFFSVWQNTKLAFESKRKLLDARKPNGFLEFVLRLFWRKSKAEKAWDAEELAFKKSVWALDYATACARLEEREKIFDNRIQSIQLHWRMYSDTYKSNYPTLDTSHLFSSQEYQNRIELIRNVRFKSDKKNDFIDIADKVFFSTRLKRHNRSLWVSRDFDLLRAQIFVHAVRLHELTIRVQAGKFSANLEIVQQMLFGASASQKIGATQFPVVWQSLFFLIPVISTTLASMSKLMRNIGKEQIGWMLIDEAGQATPQSLVGALQRSRRAVIVGDPLQIEPVVTTSPKIASMLQQHFKVTNAWNPLIQSAQTLADRTMNIGANVNSKWTGLPLRSHRRCDDPMFSISNIVAYNEQMVSATNNDCLICAIPNSIWIDVQTHSPTKVNNQELNALKEIISTFSQNWPTTIDSKGGKTVAKVYVITPFRDVKDAIEETLKPFMKKGVGLLEFGTTHTFQGKEAPVVIFVLGSITGDKGLGSRTWASKSPNLLNVAVSRAKSLFVVIGNYKDWSSLEHFKVLARKIRRVERSFVSEILSQQTLITSPESQNIDQVFHSVKQSNPVKKTK